MSHYEDLCCDSTKWKKKLLHMDFITMKCQKREQKNKRKGQEKKPGLEEHVELRGGDTRSEKQNAEFVTKEV